MEKKWFSDRYRRHLCDMHIDGWDERFLSEFEPQEYLNNLKAGGVNTAMLYFQSHAGWCYYPTRTGRMHPSFEGQPDKMRRLVNLCHENGIAVVGYYSLNYNTIEHDRHPGRMVMENGRSWRENEQRRYGLCCPNNPQYQAFVFEQIREMLDYFEVEGMFYDMPFWPHVCYCEHCRKRWADEVGGELPTDENDPRIEKLYERMRAWMGEWTQKVHDCTKSIRPEVSVEQNFANAIAGPAEDAISDAVNEACDYAGGDLYGGLEEQSFTCKYYMAVTRNQPFEYMTCRCDPNLHKHTITKSRRELESAVMITCAHHGATLLIDAIDPVGTMDARVYRLMGEVFDRQKPYEAYMAGHDLLQDVGVMFDLPSKAKRHGQKFHNLHAALQSFKTLMKRHVPVGVVTYRQMDSLPQYPVVVAPMIHTLPEASVRALIDYVENGGILYFSGAEQPELVHALLGARVTGFTEHTVTYTAPTPGKEELFDGFNEKYPLPFDAGAPIIEEVSGDAEILAHINLPYTTQNNERFASIHSNPPGVLTDLPAVVTRAFGRGRVIWSAVPIELEKTAAYGRVFMNLLNMAGLKPRVRTNASSTVELVTFREEHLLRISAVRLSGEYEGSLPGFEVQIRTGRAPEKVVLLPEGSAVEFDYADGWTKFRMRELELFDMYEIRL